MLKRIARLPFKILKTALGAVRDGGRDKPAPSSSAPPPPQPPRAYTAPAPEPEPAAAADDDGHDHGHSHDHGHDHGGGEDSAPAVSVQMESTPNPNAMKFVTSITLCSQGSKSWTSAEDAADDPLGAALFDIPGVASVFMVNDFVTVSKDAGAGWGRLTHPITEAIERHATPA